MKLQSLGCPRINTAEWKQLTELFGESGAYQVFQAMEEVPSMAQIHEFFGEDIKEKEINAIVAPIQRAIDTAGITGKNTGEKVVITYNVTDKKEEAEIDNEGEVTGIRIKEDALLFPGKVHNKYGRVYLSLLGKKNATLKSALAAFRHSSIRQDLLSENPNLKEDEELLAMETLSAALMYDSVDELFDNPKMLSKAKAQLNKYHSAVAKELNTTSGKAKQWAKELAMTDEEVNKNKVSTPEHKLEPEERGKSEIKGNIDAIYDSLLKRASRLDATRRSKADSSSYMKNLSEFVTNFYNYKDAKVLMNTLEFMKKEHDAITAALQDYNSLSGNFLSVSFNIINGYKTFSNLKIPSSIKGMTEEEQKLVIGLLKEVKSQASSLRNLEQDIEKASKHYWINNYMKFSSDPAIKRFFQQEIFQGEYTDAEFTEALKDENVAAQLYETFVQRAKDATGRQRWTDYIGDSHNKLPALFAAQYNIEETKSKKKALDLKVDFANALKGVNGNIDFILETDAKGKKTGKFKSKMVEMDLDEGGSVMVESEFYKKLNPAQKEFADTLYSIMGELLQDFEGEYADRVPAVPTDTRSMKEMVMDTFRLRDVKEKEERQLDEQGQVISFVPSKFLKNINQMMRHKIPEGADDITKERIKNLNAEIDRKNKELHAEAINFNLAKTMPAFIDAISMYNFKKGMEDQLMLTRELLARQDIIEDSHANKTKMIDKQFKRLRGKEVEIVKSLKHSRMQAQFDDWTRRVFYEDFNRDEGAFGKAMNILLQYTSLNTLGLNWKAGIGNKMYGEVQNIIEGYAGEHYTSKDYRKYWGSLNQKTASLMYKIHANETGNDADATIIRYFDVLQDTRELITGGPVENKMDKVSNVTNLAYMFNEIGEFTMQNSVLFAMMSNYQMQDANGKMTNLKESYDAVAGKLVLKKGYKKADGTTFSEDDFADFRNQVLAVIQDLHGVYTREHSAAVQKYALGRVAFQFKKWIPAALKRRFGSRFGESFHNERLKRLDEGAYITTWKFAVQLMKDYRSIADNYKVMWSELSPAQRANVHRTFGELGALLGVTLLGYGLKLALDDEDQKKWYWALTFYFQDRLMSELRTYTPIGAVDEWRKIQKSPFSAMSTYDKLINMGESLVMYPLDDDKEKALEVMGQRAIKLVPLASQVNNTIHLADNLNYYRLY